MNEALSLFFFFLKKKSLARQARQARQLFALILENPF